MLADPAPTSAALFQPRSATELVDAAVQLARRHYRPLAVLSALIAVPALLMGIVARALEPRTVSTDPAQLASAGFLIFGLALVSICILSVGFGALVVSAAQAYETDRAMEPLRAAGIALRRSWGIVGGNLFASLLVSIVATGVIMGFAIIAGLVVAIVSFSGAGAGRLAGQALATVLAVVMVVGALLAMLLFGSRYAIVTPAAVLEALGPVRSIGRSSSLVKGQLRHVAGVVAIGIVFYLVAYATVFAVAALVLRSVELASTAGSALVVLIYPFLGSLITVLYFDLRIRREGYDVELMARALGEQGTVTAVAPEPSPMRDTAAREPDGREVGGRPA